MAGDREKELSDFWDLEALLPQKKPQKPSSPHRDITATDVFSDARADDTSAPQKECTFPAGRIPPKTEQIPESVWEPSGGPIRRVAVYACPSEYPFYAQFQRDARKLYHIKGLPCRQEPFFSFVPQYSQLTRAQLNTYFYWREEVRSGRYPTIDFSYLKLYFFELINLSEELPKEEFFQKVCDVWLAYRDVFPQLDSMVSEWITDYCLLHHVLPPERLHPVLPAIQRVCSLKELFLPKKDQDSRPDATAYLTFCSGYDYHSSRYAEGEMLAQMETYIPAALSLLLDARVSSTLCKGPVQMTVERQSYTRAICASELKKRIRVTYDALSHSFEIKAQITEIVKYCENRLRAALGIKSRLTVRQLPENVKEVLNTYFDSHFPKRSKATAPTVEEEAYWKLYDAESKPMSLLDAERIESRSWATTKKLVDTFSEREAETEVPAEEIPEETPTRFRADTVFVSPTQDLVPDDTPSETGDGNSADSSPIQNTKGECPFDRNEWGYLTAIYSADRNAAVSLLSRLNLPEEALVDRINETAVGCYGDILLEETDIGFSLIPDYRSIVEELIEQYGK